MWIIPVIFAVLSLGVILALVIRKIPELRVINPESIPKEKVRRLKEQLVMDRLNRVRKAKVGKVSKVAQGAFKQASRVGRRAVQKVYALEQYYEKLQKTQAQGSAGLDKDSVKRLLDEAEQLVREEEYLGAEKRYIEVISHHPKNVDAYEGLGNLYLRSKQYQSARETMAFAVRLAPEDASVRMSMGELEMAQENWKEASNQIGKAVESRPGNPKYLDAYIESSLNAKLFDEAKKGIELLEKANPENTKLEGWKERLTELDPTPVKEE